MTDQEKIETILRHEYLEWEQMSKYDIMSILVQQRRYFLECELAQDNGEYLDDLLDEINVEKVWSTPISRT